MLYSDKFHIKIENNFSAYTKVENLFGSLLRLELVSQSLKPLEKDLMSLHELTQKTSHFPSKLKSCIGFLAKTAHNILKKNFKRNWLQMILLLPVLIQFCPFQILEAFSPI